jgi:hypothetical protein
MKVELIRREVILLSHLNEWRRARDAGTLVARKSSPSWLDRRKPDILT